jgi:Xaa-Pro aminopeptidase
MPDFETAEFEARCEAAQARMVADGIDALFLTTEAELRYFSGFRTAFWQSPTRPWFLILPARGEPVAVIPAIGADLMAQTWVRDIRCFESPAADAPHVPILRDALAAFARIATPMGDEASLRMPLTEFEALRADLRAEWCDATPLIRALRMVKSPAELALIQDICAIGSTSFAQAPALFSAGMSLWDVFAAFRIALLRNGAEEVPYLVGAAAQGGYSDVISPPTARPLRDGDVLMLDTGAMRAGYFCDFDRNWAIGSVRADVAAGHRQLWSATQGALEALRPGMTAAQAAAVLTAPLGESSDIGRVGHGLGMQLTEWPSLAGCDQTELVPGMVLTLEPSLSLGVGRMLVHEENIVVTEDGVDLLSERTPEEIPVLT